MQHMLYKTGDPDAPKAILDSNNEVVLGLCRVCHGGECSLTTNCPGRLLTIKEEDLICAGELDM